MSNLTMTIPPQWYCGFSRRGQDVPLGFITPDGTDSAATKRKATVDNWADDTLRSISFPNEPMLGFKLSRAIKRYGWNGGNTVVRIEDPRGFELEISPTNLLKIMENNTVENGEIMTKCIWGRDGNTNYLLAVNSQPYLDALVNTERKSKKVSIKDILPGNKVKLQNGQEIIWLGNFFNLVVSNGFYNDGSLVSSYQGGTPKTLTRCSPKRAYWLQNNVLYSGASLKIAEIVDNSVMPEDEINALIAHQISKGWHDTNYSGMVIGVSRQEFKNVHFTLEGQVSSTVKFKSPHYTNGVGWNFATYHGELYCSPAKHSCGTDFAKIDTFTEQEIVFVHRPLGRYSYTATPIVKHPLSVGDDDWRTLVVNATTKDGTIYKIGIVG